MKNSITINKNNNEVKVSIFDGTGVFIREVPQKVKTNKGWRTEYVDIRELKIGAELDGGIVVDNPHITNEQEEA